jgi:hypothetical protein
VAKVSISAIFKTLPKRQKFAQSGANPTTSIYNASVVNLYNATSSLARFENKNI